jgi:hypothetical protein
MSRHQSRIVVVRAWQDDGRRVIRVLAGAEHITPTREWVFVDVDDACRRIAEVLDELDSTPSGPAATLEDEPLTHQQSALRMIAPNADYPGGD